MIAKANGKPEKINFDDILFIEGMENQMRGCANFRCAKDF